MTSTENEQNIDKLLEDENALNKSGSWNKLNKTLKIQKLNSFSDRHGKQNNYSTTQIKQLKRFFADSLERKKLQKTKDVVYDKESTEIKEVPGLQFHTTTNTFSVRSDSKRVSTLRSLPPKRIIEGSEGIDLRNDALETNINSSKESI